MTFYCVMITIIPECYDTLTHSFRVELHQLAEQFKVDADLLHARESNLAVQLRTEAVQRETDRAAADSQIIELSEQRDKLQAKLNEVKAQAEIDAEVLRSQSKALQCAQEASTLMYEKQLTELRVTSQKALEDLKTERETESTHHRDQLKELQAALIQANEQLDKANLTVEELRTALEVERQRALVEEETVSAEAATSREALLAEKSLLHQQIVDMDKTLASERLKIEALSTEAAEAVTSREALLAEKTLLHQQIVDMDNTLASERLKIETLSTEAAEAVTTREALLAEKSLLHQQIADMDNTLASERLKMEAVSSKAADDLDQAQEEISALQCMLAQTQDKVSQLQTQLLDTQLQAETSQSGLNE